MANEGELRQKLTPFHLFDERMVIVSYPAWIGIGSLLSLTIAFLIWSVLGSITINASGQAISLTKEGVIHVPSRLKGRVSELRVKPGDEVKAGSLIAVIYDLEFETDLKNATQRKNDLFKDYMNAKRIAKSEESKRNISLKRNLESTQFSIDQREKQLPFLIKDVESKNTLYKEGLISANQLAEAERLVMEEQINLDQLRAKLVEFEGEMQKSYKSDEMIRYQQEYMQAMNRLVEFKARSSYLNVVSPSDGTILELQVQMGDEIKEGQSIALIEEAKAAGEDYLFYGYIPSEQGNRVKIGMKTQLRLGIVDPQKFGYLLGEVAFVSDFPVSESRLLSVVQSQVLVNYLANKHEALTEVIVKPLRDSESLSGYRWSSGKGPDIQLRTGLVAEMRVTVEKRRPISFLFPEWWVVGT